MEDVTQLRQKDEELRVQSAMIKEIHHRVKNNLQTIASLLRLEQRRASADETKRALKDAINRISSIALVHEYLSAQGSEEVDMSILGKEVFRTVLSSMGNPELQLQTSFQATPLRLPSQKAANLALVLNELVQNSLEHGFTGRRNGTLSVELFETAANIILRVQDDGVGLPKNFQPGRTRSLGLKIVQTVVQSDMKGVFYLHNRQDGQSGTVAEILLPRV
jgi:two-component system, sensor histidine kinase PdtaS